MTLAAIFGLMFAVTIAAGWEFYEFLMDTLHGTNLQLAKAGPETAMFDLAKYHGEYGYIGLVDTMTDMMMNVVGGIVGMIFMIVLRTKGNKKPAAKAKKINRKNKRTAMHTHCGSFYSAFWFCRANCFLNSRRKMKRTSGPAKKQLVQQRHGKIAKPDLHPTGKGLAPAAEMKQ